MDECVVVRYIIDIGALCTISLVVELRCLRVAPKFVRGPHIIIIIVRGPIIHLGVRSIIFFHEQGPRTKKQGGDIVRLILP
jgi:hypothetical protein